MFPLIAITAFFILGIAFFAIGKDDFGIKRVKEVSNDTSIKEKEVVNTSTAKKNDSTEEKELVSLESSSQIDSSGNASDWIVTKSLFVYLFGIIFISIGLIPIARNIFSVDLFNDAPIFFLAGGIWLLLIIAFLYSSKELKRELSTRIEK